MVEIMNLAHWMTICGRELCAVGDHHHVTQPNPATEYQRLIIQLRHGQCFQHGITGYGYPIIVTLMSLDKWNQFKR